MHRSLVPLLALLLVAPAAAVAKPNKHVCGDTAAGFAHCHARVVTDAKGTPAVTPAPNGYGPADLRAAYGLPSTTAGGGKTFAIVDAYDAPTAAPDLATYRSTYGLPPCGTGCFTKVNQAGSASPVPRANGGWAQEISLDLDMASAVCPNCRILLVEANSNAFTDLAAAEDTAARLGASVISNSYGGSEFSQETSTTYNSHFNHQGIPITVSTGDSGYGVEFPAASQYVTAVGGTSASAPIVAGAYALGGGTAPSTPYANTGSLHDVTSGSNGSCSVAYLCTAGTGFDGPTGLGTPNGVGAF